MNNKLPDGVHALLITQDGKVILQQKTSNYYLNPANRGKISMFGGRIEPGEESIAALRRELKEELGMNLDMYTVAWLNTYQKTIKQDGIEHDVHVYIVKPVDPNTLVMDMSDNEESAGERVIDTATNLVVNTNITRITQLALQDYCKANR